MTFRVLFVCTGNICRSPMAERLLQSRLAGVATARIDVASAGTRAMVGYGMDLAAAHVLRELGGDPAGHVARQLVPQFVRDAGLVLAATVAHRDAVIRSDPAAMRRTFTMREFVRLGAHLDRRASDVVAQVADIAAQRGLVEPAPPGADDIADPYGAPLPVMERCGRQISETVDSIARLLAGQAV